LAKAPQVLFLGLRGAFSAPPLQALLAAGVPVCGVLLPGGSPGSAVRPLAAGLPVLGGGKTIVELAQGHGIPVLEAAGLNHPDTLAAVRQLGPDVIAVACFDRLVPRAFRELAGLAVNVHPSLLPDNRGPAPLFWTFRLGQARTGVTVHRLEDRADAGAILEQRAVAVPDGVDGAEFEMELARIGGQLLVQVVRDFQAGRLHPRAQDETAATAHPWPAADDWTIPPDWTQRRADHFVRGVAHMSGPHLTTLQVQQTSRRPRQN
jgi:methionyl-tRNA formyltransferase